MKEPVDVTVGFIQGSHTNQRLPYAERTTEAKTPFHAPVSIGRSLNNRASKHGAVDWHGYKELME